MLQLGIDEAGRGSVLGPMVVGAFLVHQERLPELVQSGVTDSKLLSASRREALIPVLSSLGTGLLELIDARSIDEGNLNDLEIHAFARLIERTRPDQVTIDAPVNPRGIARFSARLLGMLSFTPKLIVECKADLNHVCVGAASVFAKVQRDAEVRALGPVGSGYPSDPRTRALLAELMRSGEPLPPWVRSRWGTIRDIRQQSLFSGPEAP